LFNTNIGWRKGGFQTLATLGNIWRKFYIELLIGTDLRQEISLLYSLKKLTIVMILTTFIHT
jgi:hypothetical protein